MHSNRTVNLVAANHLHCEVRPEICPINRSFDHALEAISGRVCYNNFRTNLVTPLIPKVLRDEENSLLKMQKTTPFVRIAKNNEEKHRKEIKDKGLYLFSFPHDSELPVVVCPDWATLHGVSSGVFYTVMRKIRFRVCCECCYLFWLKVVFL